MEQVPSSETNIRLSSQEIPQISRNWNFSFPSNKMSELIPNLTQMNPHQVLKLYIFNLIFNIIIKSTHTSINCLILFLIFKTKTHTIVITVM
jgi:hypothetical protein